MSILIVEDERIVAEDLQRTLIDWGYDVFAIASSAEAALKCVLKRRPDLVMMDIRIKGPHDGIHTAAILKEKSATAIIYLTAHADGAMIERAKMTEPHGYLLKPVNLSELRIAVEIAFYKHQLEQARAENKEIERQNHVAILEMGRAVRESNEHFRMMVEAVKDYAIIMLEVDGRVASWNVGAARLKGYCEQEIVGQHFSRFYTAEDIARHKPQRELETAARLGSTTDQGWIMRNDGTQFFAEVVITAVYDTNSQLRGFSNVTQDITARKQSETLLSHQAAHDALTDLPNRVLFADRLAQAMATVRRNHTSLALLYLDLDGFKLINDSLGHANGDLLLQSVAQRLTQCVRASDTVIRHGGDEFVILLVNIDGHRDAAICAEKNTSIVAGPLCVERTRSARVGKHWHRDVPTGWCRTGNLVEKCGFRNVRGQDWRPQQLPVLPKGS